jgi:hypothetical protein
MRPSIPASSRFLFPVFLCLVAAGCNSGRDLFPLEVGRAWKYSVVDEYGPRMADVRVASRARVGDRMGFEIVGDDGPSRLAWEGSTLLASEMLGTAFHPPLPILRGGAEHARWSWQGTIRNAGRLSSAVVRASQEPSSAEDLGREVGTIRVTLTVETATGSFTVETHYRTGVGILRQEVRRGSDQTLLLTLAAGR